MDESTNPQSVDEGEPFDVDSQAAEPRGRLGWSGDDNASGEHGGAAGEDGAADSRGASESRGADGANGSAGAAENHDSGDGPAADQGDLAGDHGEPATDRGEHATDQGGPAAEGRTDEGGPEDRRLPGEDDIGGDSQGSNRSFLLGLAWWP
ncbi:hypothetical protein OG589_16160 [Sphaerisporangium sp. NBC_01403]|uniref:hypothetical protein n=1 Tax=Sphaerisporangium sp. NBC_01403 TaxID=2903599 RepID=UPI0032480FDA